MISHVSWGTVLLWVSSKISISDFSSFSIKNEGKRDDDDDDDNDDDKDDDMIRTLRGEHILVQIV